MYSMVMMMAVAGSGDVASFGGRNKGCDGGGCNGYVATSSCGGKHGGGFLGGRRDRGGCNGNTCSGYVAAPACCAAPAPVYAAPVSYGCSGYVDNCGCNGGGKHFGRRKGGSGCYSAPTNCCAAPVAGCCGNAAYAPAPCATGTAVMPAVPATPAKEMPKPVPSTPKKDN